MENGSIEIKYAPAVIAAAANLLTLRPSIDLSAAASAGQNVGWSCGLAAGGLGNATR